VDKKARTTIVRLGLAALGTVVAVSGAEVALRVWVGLSDPARLDLNDALSGSPGRQQTTLRSEPAQLRDLLRASRDPDLVYELKPDLDRVFLGVPVQTNSFGMRDRERTRDKSSSTIRLAGLGDSVMFGWGVTAEEGFLAVAEVRLQQELGDDRRLEIMNFAVPGYNTAMEVAAFRGRVLEFEPDAVVIHLVNNDLDLPRFMLDPPDLWATDRLWLADLVREGRSAARRHGRWFDPGDVDRMPEIEGSQLRERYRHLAGEEAYRAALAELSALTEARGIPVIMLALQDHGSPWETGAQCADEMEFQLEIFGPRLSEYLVQNKIPGTRNGWIETFWLSPEDPHPNELGHRLMADALVEAVISLGIVTKTLNVER